MRLLPLAMIALLLITPLGAAGQPRGLLVVVTFPNLAEDVRQILCEGDRVISIVPPGADPHDYQLTPSDVEALKAADIIVSTAHAPFESDIRKMVDSGGFRAVLIEIPRIPGMKILNNPLLGNPNLHMPIYDPENYKVFITYLSRAMSELRPERSSYYEEKASEVLAKLRSVEELAPKLSAVAAADTPVTQYAVSWLGVRIKYLMIREHGVPATPKDVQVIEEALDSGEVNLVVVLKPTETKASEKLVSMAREKGVPVLFVPSPFTPGSMVDKLLSIVEQARGLQERRAVRRGEAPPTNLAAVGTIAAVVLALLAVLSVTRGAATGTTGALRIVMQILVLGIALALAYSTSPLWLAVMLSAAVAYGFLSAVIAARGLYFLAGASAHSALLAAVLGVPLARLTGLGNEYTWGVVVGLLLTYAVGYLIHRGVKSDIATSVFVSATASGSVVAIYYVLTRFPLQTDVWAIIVGDPLLASWPDAYYALAVAAVTAVAVVLTYREEVCIGAERSCMILTGVNVKFYDWLVFTLLGLTTVAMIKVVGFVLEHVLVLLPSAIAVSCSRSSSGVLYVSAYVSVIASLLGLYAAVAMDQAPAGVTGLILLAMYIATLLSRRGAE